MIEISRAVRNAVASGVAATFILLWLLSGVPAIGLAAGLVVTVVVLLLTGDGRKRYAVAGTAYLLIVGTFLAVADAIGISVPSAETIVPATVLFGLLSLLIISVRAAGRTLFRRVVGAVFGPETAERIFDSVTSLLSAIGLLFLLPKLKRRVLINGGFLVGGNATFGLSLLGIERSITVPRGETEIDIVLFLFVGTLLAGFYTFDSLNSTWLATNATAKKSVETGKRVHAKTTSVIEEKRGSRTDTDDE